MNYLTDNQAAFVLDKMAAQEERSTFTGYKVRAMALRYAANILRKDFRGTTVQQDNALRYSYLRNADPQHSMAIFGSCVGLRLDGAIDDAVEEEIRKAIAHE